MGCAGSARLQRRRDRGACGLDVPEASSVSRKPFWAYGRYAVHLQTKQSNINQSVA